MKFVRTSRYAKDLRRIRASDIQADAIEREIAENPEAGDVIPGLRGLRKLRFRLGNRGKRGGGRAIYYLVLAEDTVILLTAYAKNEQTDLTPAQRKAILAVMEALDDG